MRPPVVPSATTYADLPETGQIASLLGVAREAAPMFGLRDAVVTPVLHAYNSTFRIDCGEASYALRILVGSKSTTPNVVAQQDWQLALAAETGVAVPVPLRAVDGSWSATVPSAAFGRDAIVTVASWLDGDAVETVDEDVARMLGAAMAGMHEHARSWPMPAGGGLPVYDDVLFGDRDAIADVDDLSRAARRVLDVARSRAQTVLTRVHAADAVRVLHADMHAGNVLRTRDGLQVLDFDDAGLGVPALDLAIARFSQDDAAQHEALAAGYAGVAPLPDVDDADLHALAAGRQLLLANDLLSSSTASLRADARTYLDTAVRRLEAWLDTGTFTRRVG